MIWVTLCIALAVALAGVCWAWRKSAHAARVTSSRWRHSEAALMTARAEVARLVGGLSASGDGLMVLDEASHVIAINPAACALAGVTEGVAAGTRIDEVVPWVELHTALREVGQDGVTRTFELALEADAAPATVLTISVRPLDDLGTVVVLEDQSRIKQLESIRRDFVANVSHELKTPLAAIKGFVETIQDDEDMPSTTRHHFIARIHVQAERLATLVSDLLTISRLDDEVVDADRQAVDMVSVLNEAVQHLMPIAERREIELRSEIESEVVWILADREALRQTVGNLIDNALKYTPERGAVTVRLGVEDQRSARLEVADTGIGLSPADQERVFERFYRVDRARSRELGGTGLGLSIVKNTVLNLGGEIGVRSELGVGSLFWVRLPIASAEASQER